MIVEDAIDGLVGTLIVEIWCGEQLVERDLVLDLEIRSQLVDGEETPFSSSSPSSFPPPIANIARQRLRHRSRRSLPGILS